LVLDGAALVLASVFPLSTVLLWSLHHSQDNWNISIEWNCPREHFDLPLPMLFGHWVAAMHFARPAKPICSGTGNDMALCGWWWWSHELVSGGLTDDLKTGNEMQLTPKSQWGT